MSTMMIDTATSDSDSTYSSSSSRRAIYSSATTAAPSTSSTVEGWEEVPMAAAAMHVPAMATTTMTSKADAVDSHHAAAAFFHPPPAHAYNDYNENRIRNIPPLQRNVEATTPVIANGHGESGGNSGSGGGVFQSAKATSAAITATLLRWCVPPGPRHLAHSLRGRARVLGEQARHGRDAALSQAAAAATVVVQAVAALVAVSAALAVVVAIVFWASVAVGLFGTAGVHWWFLSGPVDGQTLPLHFDPTARVRERWWWAALAETGDGTMGEGGGGSSNGGRQQAQEIREAADAFWGAMERGLLLGHRQHPPSTSDPHHRHYDVGLHPSGTHRAAHSPLSPASHAAPPSAPAVQNPWVASLPPSGVAPQQCAAVAAAAADRRRRADDKDEDDDEVEEEDVVASTQTSRDASPPSDRRRGRTRTVARTTPAPAPAATLLAQTAASLAVGPFADGIGAEVVGRLRGGRQRAEALEGRRRDAFAGATTIDVADAVPQQLFGIDEGLPAHRPRGMAGHALHDDAFVSRRQLRPAERLRALTAGRQYTIRVALQLQVSVAVEAPLQAPTLHSLQSPSSSFSSPSFAFFNPFAALTAFVLGDDEGDRFSGGCHHGIGGLYGGPHSPSAASFPTAAGSGSGCGNGGAAPPRGTVAVEVAFIGARPAGDSGPATSSSSRPAPLAVPVVLGKTSVAVHTPSLLPPHLHALHHQSGSEGSSSSLYGWLEWCLSPAAVLRSTLAFPLRSAAFGGRVLYALCIDVPLAAAHLAGRVLLWCCFGWLRVLVFVARTIVHFVLGGGGGGGDSVTAVGYASSTAAPTTSVNTFLVPVEVTHTIAEGFMPTAAFIAALRSINLTVFFTPANTPSYAYPSASNDVATTTAMPSSSYSMHHRSGPSSFPSPSLSVRPTGATVVGGAIHVVPVFVTPEEESWMTGSWVWWWWGCWRAQWWQYHAFHHATWIRIAVFAAHAIVCACGLAAVAVGAGLYAASGLITSKR